MAAPFINISPPIIVSEHGDIEFYGSVDEVEVSLEAIDVTNEEYQIYDSLGWRLLVSVEPRVKRYRWLPCLSSVIEHVVLDGDEVGPNESAVLAQQLREFLGRVSTKRVDEWSLEQLVAYGVKRCTTA